MEQNPAPTYGRGVDLTINGFVYPFWVPVSVQKAQIS